MSDTRNEASTSTAGRTVTGDAAGRVGTSGDSRVRRPIRWGGVVWGVILIVFAAATLTVLSARDRLVAAQVWFAALSPASAWALGLAVAGGIIVVLAVLGGVSGAQRRRRR